MKKGKNGLLWLLPLVLVACIAVGILVAPEDVEISFIDIHDLN